MPNSPVPIYPLCFALVAVGKVAEANEHLSNLKNMAVKMYVPPYFFAMSHVAVGEIDVAFEFFEQAFAERSPWVMWFGTEAKLDVIRDDPRYLKLLRSTNNPIAF